ncbi:hypothetical protein B0H14DRAFT_1121879 [Mycena olivaceomarginata]|nr:hypothetical protein B0H14DRAFT_1121879 [Mycena olivaceomarginata]
MRREHHSPLPCALLCRLRSAILVVAPSPSPCLPLLETAFGSSWASTATPSLAGRPWLVTLLPSVPAPSSILPTIYLMLHRSLSPTPPSSASCGGRDFVGNAQCPRYFQGVLPRVGKLERRVAGVDSTSAASAGAPTTMRERGERWTMGAEDASTWRTEGWEAHGWGAGVLEPCTVGSRRALGLT